MVFHFVRNMFCAMHELKSIFQRSGCRSAGLKINNRMGAEKIHVAPNWFLKQAQKVNKLISNKLFEFRRVQGTFRYYCFVTR